MAVEWRRVDDEVIALDVARREYFAINDSGATLWPLLVEGTTEERLVDALTDRFDVPETIAADGVLAFLSELDGRALLLRG
ncbi:hypothetical protein Val02_91690 [Virgisporangium aliadipatigenens]|uniref:PqqD family protein n=1 Tax=Virgisporangium aliadipatigenens TaxID=741659 RepID=A0A8J3YZ78_9ACTN|nr:PqqD family protein [Virgisporangium aliadipatigenens]GIJ52283.1 hypothetical protein Val02_91690 [Virgisporangium aliadipatigenens]